MSPPAAIAEKEPVSDGQLMESVSAGNVRAFAELYDRYCNRAYSVALSVCGDAGRAEDAVRAGFRSIWKGRASYPSQQGTVAAWMLTVVHRRAVDLVRDDGDRRRASILWLRDAEREVIVLALYGRLSHAEIAAQLGLPSATVKTRMRLGLQTLRTSSDHTSA
jgi:RNA polymerase sigma-70 factor (ECF subfamily)